MTIIDNEKQTVGQVFNYRFPIQLSKHQRAYSWEEEEVKSYCNDILSINNEYFFGGIVSVKQNAHNGPGCIYRLVDGQQRLATFTLTIARLKLAFEAISEDARSQSNIAIADSSSTVADELYRNQLAYVDTYVIPSTTNDRFTLSKVDETYFKNLMSGNIPTPSTVSHDNLKTAWNTIGSLLIDPILSDASLNVTNKFKELHAIKVNLLDKSVVINIITDKVDEAYQLFEILNDRGKELALGDFLRSSTLELLEGHTKEQDQVAANWDYILGKSDAEKFLKSYLTSYTSKIDKVHVHRQFENQFFNFTSPLSTTDKQKIVNTAQDMKDKYDIFENINDGIWPFNVSGLGAWDKNRLNLLINELKHTLCIPFLLAIYNVSNEQTFNEVIQLTEKVVFRYISATGSRANRLSDIYKKHIIAIQSLGTFNLAVYRADLSQLLQHYSDDTTFENALEKKLIYSKNNIKKIRYFLTTIEDHYVSYTRGVTVSPVKNIVHDVASIDIEHIYPQTPQTVVQSLKPLTNNLGNLTFWDPGDNRSAQNDTFSNKKFKYKDSNVRLTRELQNHANWDANKLKERLKLYQDIAKKVFTI
ncbi:DUF262 domain-containing HNH endonuclease family protein [Priestia megaterium]|uniref:DUF262 domain-containing protein n=1 Tax=Priestia megaterium TaxID=1404 RepID=UPI0020768CCA|nr:DUF262 domain-containing protein [Priestia megaterium]USD14101.1 DUF262 domain-containing HNH endonuclease family protein [Priestia megaterium]